MYNIAVMGERDSIYGFAALGITTFFVEGHDEASKCLKSLVVGDYSVIYITERTASFLEEELEELREKTLPAVILIPGIHGNTGRGMERVKKSVEQAVGSDIIFND